MLENELLDPLTIIINRCIDDAIFPEELKLANITPVYKKKDRLNKDNYRSVNVLVVLSKIFEMVMESQIIQYFNLMFNSLLSGFRKRHNCQYVIIKMTEILV